MAQRWSSDPKYSHGFLVPVFAGVVLWTRRPAYPGVQLRLSWEGIPWLGVAGLMRLASAGFYFEWLDALSLLPALTADYYGPRHLGSNYGLVFLGWGMAFFVPQLAGFIKDRTGSLDGAFYLSGGLLLAAVVVSRCLRRPLAPGEKQA